MNAELFHRTINEIYLRLLSIYVSVLNDVLFYIPLRRHLTKNVPNENILNYFFAVGKLLMKRHLSYKI